LAAAPIDQIVVTDSIPITEHHDKLVVLSVAPLLAEGIRRVHEDRSVSELFRDTPLEGVLE
jgi:ribose-phosphate pyrophosphokinase